MRPLTKPALLWLAAAGCALPTRGIGAGVDGGPMDAAPQSDGGPADSGQVDAGALATDSGTDAGGFDAGGSDAGSLDAGGDDAGPASPDFLLEAEDHDRTSSSDGVHAFATDTLTSGFSGAGYIVSLPDSSATCTASALASCGAVAEYDVIVPTTDHYRPFFRYQAGAIDDDSYYWQLDDLGVHVEHTALPDEWTWDRGRTRHRLTAGSHTLYFYMRENGFQLDQIFLTTTGAPP